MCGPGKNGVSGARRQECGHLETGGLWRFELGRDLTFSKIIVMSGEKGSVEI